MVGSILPMHSHKRRELSLDFGKLRVADEVSRLLGVGYVVVLRANLGETASCSSKIMRGIRPESNTEYSRNGCGHQAVPIPHHAGDLLFAAGDKFLAGSSMAPVFQ